MAFGPEYAATQQAGIYGDAKMASGGDTEQSPFYALGVTLEQANMLAQRVISLADRLVGPVPTPVQGNTNASSPSAVFPAVRASAYQTQGFVGEAFTALDRIERALP